MSRQATVRLTPFMECRLGKSGEERTQLASSTLRQFRSLMRGLLTPGKHMLARRKITCSSERLLSAFCQQRKVRRERVKTIKPLCSKQTRTHMQHNSRQFKGRLQKRLRSTQGILIPSRNRTYLKRNLKGIKGGLAPSTSIHRG